MKNFKISLITFFVGSWSSAAILKRNNCTIDNLNTKIEKIFDGQNYHTDYRKMVTLKCGNESYSFTDVAKEFEVLFLFGKTGNLKVNIEFETPNTEALLTNVVLF